jgi:hypothetical protein
MDFQDVAAFCRLLSVQRGTELLSDRAVRRMRVMEPQHSAPSIRQAVVTTSTAIINFGACFAALVDRSKAALIMLSVLVEMIDRDERLVLVSLLPSSDPVSHHTAKERTAFMISGFRGPACVTNGGLPSAGG